MVAVAVLIVIAIAGLVLAGLRSRGAAPGQTTGTDATQQGAPPLTGAAATAAASASAEDAAAGPNQILFAPASDQLSEAAASKVVRLAETARKEHRKVAILLKVEARPDRAEQMNLARKRSMAVRQLLEANGIPLGTMRIEISELPNGLVSAAEANRVDVALQ